MRLYLVPSALSPNDLKERAKSVKKSPCQPQTFGSLRNKIRIGCVTTAPRNRNQRARPKPVSPSASQGFTLLEMMLVMFVVILGFAVIGLNISSGTSAASHESAARDLVSALRFAKGEALISHQQTTVSLDLNDNTYTVSDRDKVFSIPEDIALTVVTAQEELTGEGLASIRFFPDGSSTGGRIKLERNGALWQIDINWLTGQIELEKM